MTEVPERAQFSETSDTRSWDPAEPPPSDSPPTHAVEVTPPHLAPSYEDQGEIGRGGMSVVREVRDRNLLRPLALKHLYPEAVEDPSKLQRFLEEARITGQLDHPNIVPVHELSCDDDGGWFFTMKLVQGQTLEEILSDLGMMRLAPEHLSELLQVFLKACEAMAFAHSKGVIHRDLKPSNIMVGEFGQVYIMDWGLARVLPRPLENEDGVELSPETFKSDLDPPGTVIGTPCYMAPEQVEGTHEEVDERTDVFALGATLYHLLTGKPPYQGDNYYTLLVAALHCAPKPPEDLVIEGEVPGELARITKKAMAPDPSARYASAMELRRDVERFLRGSWHLPTRSFSAGTDIVREGTVGEYAYIITRGRCVVLKRSGKKQVELRQLGPGDVFGETAIISAMPRTATVRALERVEVMVVDHDTLTRGVGLHSWMGRFVKALADRFREVDERLRKLEGE